MLHMSLGRRVGVFVELSRGDVDVVLKDVNDGVNLWQGDFGVWFPFRVINCFFIGFT